MKVGHGGFSLVEVVITIVVVGILAAIATPAVISTLPRYRLRAEFNELVINFKRAKIEAVKRNREVILLFVDAPAGQAGGSYRMFVNVDRDLAVPHTFNPPIDIQLVNQQVRTSVRLTSNFVNEQAGYTPRGLPIQAANQNVTLTTTDGSRTRVITVTQAGNVRQQ